MKRRCSWGAIAGLVLALSVLEACTMPVSRATLFAVTPTLASFPFPATATPTTARAPLTNAAEISQRDYGKQLIVSVGQTFVLHRAKDDEEPLNIDNSQVLLAESDPQGDAVTLRAIGVGDARVSTLIVYPCDAAYDNCKPPDPFTYIRVKVVNQAILVPVIRK